MKCLLQRVRSAKVDVNEECIATIGQGMLVFVGFEKNDSSNEIDAMVRKLLGFRIFADEQDQMNLNIKQIGGELLVVPQFTLAANTQKGLRPSFSEAAKPSDATELFIQFSKRLKSNFNQTQFGEFGADMQVHLTNDGPVTFWLST